MRFFGRSLTGLFLLAVTLGLLALRWGLWPLLSVTVAQRVALAGPKPNVSLQPM